MAQTLAVPKSSTPREGEQARARKIDLYREYRAEYAATRKPQLVQVGPARYLTIVGQGEPAGETFTAKVGALYSVAYTIKMMRKQQGQDYKVAGLEGLWWMEGGETDPRRVPRTAWSWKLIMRIPEFVGNEDLEAALADLRRKGKPAEIEEVRIETIDEGSSIQMLHVGPYADEPDSVAQMETFAEAHGLEFHQYHHEIYLSDPRRVPPERLRTILRHPVRPRDA